MSRIFLLAILTLYGCQTNSTYGPAVGSGAGYSDSAAAQGRTTVIYMGRKGMSPRQVAEFAMLRAAELTLANGNDWFAVVEAMTRPPDAQDINSIAGRTGSVLTNQATTAGAGGGGDKSSAAPGVSDGIVPGGPSIGGFGGSDVPYQVIERWMPQTPHRTIMVIQMGSGSRASFDGLDKAPEIYSAKAIAREIRSKMSR